MGNYILCGPPGSGKSTVAKKMADKYGYEYISIGEIARDEIDRCTELGAKLKKYIDLNVEYPPELILGVVSDKINLCLLKNKHFFLDGYPKYSWEVTDFLILKNKLGLTFHGVIVFDVSLCDAKQRIKNRRICIKCDYQDSIQNTTDCPGCKERLISREDDKEVLVEERLNDYTNKVCKTLRVLEEEKIPIFTIDASKKEEDVLASFVMVHEECIKCLSSSAERATT